MIPKKSFAKNRTSSSIEKWTAIHDFFNISTEPKRSNFGYFVLWVLPRAIVNKALETMFSYVFSHFLFLGASFIFVNPKHCISKKASAPLAPPAKKDGDRKKIAKTFVFGSDSLQGGQGGWMLFCKKRLHFWNFEMRVFDLFWGVFDEKTFVLRGGSVCCPFFS